MNYKFSLILVMKKYIMNAVLFNHRKLSVIVNITLVVHIVNLVVHFIIKKNGIKEISGMVLNVKNVSVLVMLHLVIMILKWLGLV